MGQRTYGAVDMIELGSPYRDAIARPPELASPVQLDQLEEFPWAQSFFDELRSGNFPLWDPHAGAGVPSGTLPLKGVLSPFSLPFLVLPGWYALGLKVALTLVFCQGFTYLLLRRFGISKAVAILGAIAYTFQGVNIIFIHRVSAQMVLPAMLYFADRLVDQPSLKRSAPLSVFLAWGWFEGFPSGWVYCLYLTAAWCGWLIVRPETFRLRRMLHKAKYVTTAFVLGVALAAINLVPFLSEVTSRGILEDRQYGSSSHLPPIQLFGLFDLDAIGRYPDGPWWSGLNPVESISHFGLIVALGMGAGLLAASLGRVKLTRHARVAWTFFCGLAVVGLILNFAGGPLLTAAYQLPGIANNLIARSRFTLGLAAAILAALSLDWFWRRVRNIDDNQDRVTAPRVASAVTLMAFAAMAAVHLSDYLQLAAAAGETDAIASSVGRNLLLAVATLGLALAARRFSRLIPASAAAIAVLLFIQLALPLRDFTPSAPVANYYSVREGHRVLDDLVGDRHRFAAAGRFTFSLNSGQIFEIPDLRGMALPSDEFKALGEALSPEAFSQATLGIMIPRDGWDLSSPLLDDLAVRYFALGTEERPFGALYHEDAAWDEWRHITDGFVESAEFTAAGPVTGIALPIKGNQGCALGTMTLSLHSGDGRAASSSRPSFDLLSDWVHYGLNQEQVRRADWYWFAIDGQNLEAGDTYNVSVSSTNPRCRLEVGALGSGDEGRPAIQVMGPDPSYPLRLVSTEQAWIYERPTAWNLVSAHSRWRAFPDQQSALAYSANRPDSQRDVVSYVGEEVAPEEGAVPARLSDVDIGSDHVQFTTAGASRSLIVVSQNADPGWQAEVDGRSTSIVKVDGALKGIFVPPGEHRVRIRYQPNSFVFGAWTSAAAALILALTAAVPRRRARDAE